jgi:hypothetical protein
MFPCRLVACALALVHLCSQRSASVFFSSRTHHIRLIQVCVKVQITYLSKGHHAAFVFRALSEKFTPVVIPKHPVAPTQRSWFEEKVEVVKKR